jgi:hypothetical protein
LISGYILTSLFSNNKDILTTDVESWKSFANNNNLNSERERELFTNMLNEYCNYISIILDAKGQCFISEPLVMALILSQHKKMINWLIDKISERKEKR